MEKGLADERDLCWCYDGEDRGMGDKNKVPAMRPSQVCQVDAMTMDEISE